MIIVTISGEGFQVKDKRKAGLLGTTKKDAKHKGVRFTLNYSEMACERYDS